MTKDEILLRLGLIVPDAEIYQGFEKDSMMHQSIKNAMDIYAQQQVKNLTIPVVIKCSLCKDSFNKSEQLPEKCICDRCSKSLKGY